MASSSDWIAALQAPAHTNPSQPPGWMDLFQSDSPSEAPGFIEGWPSARRQSAPAASAAEDQEPFQDHASEALSEPGSSPACDPVADAFDKGLAEGRAQAEAAHTAMQAKMQAETQESQRAVRLNFRALDQSAMDTLAHELAETVIALCSQTIEDMEPDADALLARCRKAAERIGGSAKECALHLHPADIALIDPGTLEHWRIVPDESLARGGLRFEGPDSAVSDGPSDWRRAIAAAVRG